MPPPLLLSSLLPSPLIQTLIRRLSTSHGGGGVSLYLSRARIIDTLRLQLHSHSPTAPFPLPSSPLLDSVVASHILRSSPSLSHALSFFRSLPSSSSSHPAVSLALARRLALSRHIPHLRSLLASLSPPVPPLLRLRLFSLARDPHSSLDLFSQIKSDASRANRHPCTEAYNLIIDLYALNGENSDAVDVFVEMIEDGANPNSRTYTVIIDHLVRSGHVDSAVEVFRMLPVMRVRRTSKQYNVIAEALSGLGRFEDLDGLVKEMKDDGILAGRAMREAIARLRLAGFKEVTEEFVSELCPNEKIGYVTDDDDDGGGDSDDNGNEVNGGESASGDRKRLKPWLDPTALAGALNGWDPAEVKELELGGFVWTSRLVCKMLRAFKKPEPAWEFFCWVSYQPGEFTHDRQTVSRMTAILARAGHVELIERLLSKLQSERIQLPFATLRLAIDFYGLSKKHDAAIRLYRNASLVCGPLTELNRLLLCSSLLRTLVKCKRKHEAMELLEEMIGEGVLLDLQTFSGLLQHFAEQGDLKNVHKLFGLIRQCGLRPDGYMYRVLIRAYCKNERSALGLRVFEEMRNVGLVPDRSTKGLLVKSLWKEGKLREAATVEERCEGLEERIPIALPGHVWTVSETDFRRVCDIYSGCFKGKCGAISCEGVNM